MRYQYPFKSKYVLGTKYGVKGKSWKCGYHSGLDLKSRNYGGDGKIYPVADGVVESLNTHGVSYGRHLVVKHADGMLSLYAHLEFILVTKGQKVTTTTVLGREGTTGNSTGLHLHLELHKNKYHYPATIDPQKWLDEHKVVLPSTKPKEEEKLEIKKLTVYVNDKAVVMDALYQDGTNYVKLRDLAGSLDAKVSYDAATKRIDIKK